MALTDENQIAKESESSVIARTAIATLFWIVVSFALLLTAARAVFPLAAANVYLNFGNTARAYDCAASAARLHGGDSRVNARIIAVNSSISLMGENPGEYAEAVISETEAFFADTGCVDLYSYADYISGENTRARFISGEQSVSNFGKPVAYSDLAAAIATCAESEQNYYYAAPLISSAAVVAEECIKANKPLPFDEAAVTAAAREYLNKAIGGTDVTNPTLKSLYEVKAYQKYARRIISGGFATNERKAAIENVTVGEAETTIDELYYKILLKNYCK